MVQIKKVIKRYRFFLILVLLNIILLIFQPTKGIEVITLSFDNFKEMLSVIPSIFILMGLMDVWVPKETIMKYMGKNAEKKVEYLRLF